MRATQVCTWPCCRSMGSQPGAWRAQERAISSSTAWRAQIAEVDAATLRCLREQVAGGFDEERFGARIGFGNLKRCAARLLP